MTKEAIEKLTEEVIEKFSTNLEDEEDWGKLVRFCVSSGLSLAMGAVQEFPERSNILEAAYGKGYNAARAAKNAAIQKLIDDCKG